MNISNIINIVSIILNVIAIIIAPIVSVKIAQSLQDRAKKRQDKMEIFKTLMTSRIYGWTTQSVNALNSIDIIFSDDETVRKQWKAYYDKLCVENPTSIDLNKIKIEQDKLLEEMSKLLGYKDKISWETIQNPYIPKGMVELMNNQQKFQNNQTLILESIKNNMPNFNGGNINGKNENAVR